MKSDIIKDEILDILESLKEQIPVLLGYNEKIPRIELDIVLSNLRRIYENINELKNISHSIKADTISVIEQEVEKTDITIKVEKSEEEEEKNQEETIVETTVEISEEVTSEEEFVEIKEPEDAIDRPLREGVKIVFETKEEEIIQPQKREIKEKTTIDLFSSSETSVADKFKEDSKSINEKIISDKEDHSIAARMQKGRISDLKFAIGLNEKFLFINELFDGNMKDYANAIDLLNK